MSAPAIPAKPGGLASMLSWGRVRFTLTFSAVFGAMIGLHYESGALFLRTMLVALVAMLAFGLFEQWPKRLPAWLARWVLQVVAVAFGVPVGMIVTLIPFGQLKGDHTVIGLGLLIAPWVALTALVRQKDALARHQALAFDLERSELARQAVDARLRLLQGQVAPHFLFNTLANVQALVDSGSPQAPAVLRSLVAYLRAAVPRLDEPVTTLGQELELVQAYLELMHMRMPDRLQFALHVDDGVRGMRCPPMTLLTLVENAVRHGIDPSEQGGRIDIFVQRSGDRCTVRVSDTGAGLRQSGDGLGTGLTALRERLQLTFGGDARLHVTAQDPRGVSAEADFPAREGTS